MPYMVMVDDNFHDMDEDERDERGAFADAGTAIAHCRAIVDRYLQSSCEPGMSASKLWDGYTSFGQDPFVVSTEAARVPLSAWSYAKERCEVLCARENPRDPPTPPS